MKFSRSIILSSAVILSASHSTNAFSSSSARQLSCRGNRVTSTSLASSTSTKAETATAIGAANGSTNGAANSANGAKDAPNGSTNGAATNGASNGSTNGRATLTPEFQTARDAAVAALLANLQKYQAPPALEVPLVHFMDEYFAALCVAASHDAKNPDGSPITAQQATKKMLQTVNFGMKYGLGGSKNGKFTFQNVRHTALRGDPDDERYKDEKFLEMLGDDAKTDFYAAGCDFFRPAMDLANSTVLGKENLAKALEQIRNGENVVFLANHQSEADPQVFSCLLETVGPEYGGLASHVTYVAGHKVTTDPLAVPFSMGRNLLCIHSKKHIDADAQTKPAKQKQNLAAMNEMLQMMKEGGVAIWVAPSGGRDRRDVSTGKIPIAPYDQKTVDMFRLMGNKSKKPTHFYPLSMVSYDLCPPPDFIEAGVGEQRNVRFTPIGIAVMDEVPNIGGAEKRHLFTEKAEEETVLGYEELLKKLGMEKYLP